MYFAPDSLDHVRSAATQLHAGAGAGTAAGMPFPGQQIDQ